MTMNQGAGTKVHRDWLDTEFPFHSVSKPHSICPICLGHSQPEHCKSYVPGTPVLDELGLLVTFE